MEVRLYDDRTLEKPKFHHPGNMTIYGPSKSGKTRFLMRLIRFRRELFQFSPHAGGHEFKKVYYFFGVWQEAFAEMQKEYGDYIVFYDGFPSGDISQLVKETPALVILDDLENEVTSHDEAKNLLSKYSHHKDYYVCMVFQALFGKGGSNAVRLREQMDVQVFLKFMNEETGLKKRFSNFVDSSGALKIFLETYKKWVAEKGGYLVADFHPDQSPSQALQRFRTRIFPDDGYSLVLRIRGDA